MYCSSRAMKREKCVLAWVELLLVTSRSHMVTDRRTDKCKISIMMFVHMTYTGCRFAIAPGVEALGLRIGVSFFRQNHTKVPKLTTVLTIRSNDSAIVDATIVTVSNTCQPVNSSLCHIASLEVYRGRRQITKISHDGFFLKSRRLATRDSS